MVVVTQEDEEVDVKDIKLSDDVKKLIATLIDQIRIQTNRRNRDG